MTRKIEDDIRDYGEAFETGDGERIDPERVTVKEGRYMVGKNARIFLGDEEVKGARISFQTIERNVPFGYGKMGGTYTMSGTMNMTAEDRRKFDEFFEQIQREAVERQLKQSLAEKTASSIETIMRTGVLP